MQVVTHVVIFTWIAEATEAQIADLGEALNRLTTELSDLVTISHGRDLRFRDGNGDYALVATFVDRAAWIAYQAHPSHKAFVRDFVTPLQASRLTIQF
jgi:predicted NAD/FAD-binding protein